MTRQLAAWLLLAALTVVEDEPKVGDVLQVKVFETGLKPSKSRLTKDLMTLKEGSELTVESVDPYWLGVKVQDKSGFVLRSVVVPRGSLKLSSEADTSTVSKTEQSAATKAFNPEVEKKYKEASGAAIQQAFKVVDRIQDRTVKVEDLQAFVQDGKLKGANP
ncbi:MAG: hypothetical protein U1E76_01725 [Planctomycetota bacterium]